MSTAPSWRTPGRVRRRPLACRRLPPSSRRPAPGPHTSAKSVSVPSALTGPAEPLDLLVGARQSGDRDADRPGRRPHSVGCAVTSVCAKRSRRIERAGPAIAEQACTSGGCRDCDGRGGSAESFEDQCGQTAPCTSYSPAHRPLPEDHGAAAHLPGDRAWWPLSNVFRSPPSDACRRPPRRFCRGAPRPMRSRPDRYG